MGTSAPVIVETWEEPKIFITIPNKTDIESAPERSPVEVPINR